MNKIFLLLILSFSELVYGQDELGIGLISVEFTDTTTLFFYKNKEDVKPTHVVDFFADSKINSINIKDLDKKEWLKPEVLWIDYNAFVFRCVSKTDKWIQVVTNNETGEKYWLRSNHILKFQTWSTFLKNVVGVSRLQHIKQKIRKFPSIKSKEIKFEGDDCFQVKTVQNEWIEIFTPDYCDDTIEIKSGWIKWKDKNKLLIEYFLIM